MSPHVQYCVSSLPQLSTQIGELSSLGRPYGAH